MTTHCLRVVNRATNMSALLLALTSIVQGSVALLLDILEIIMSVPDRNRTSNQTLLVTMLTLKRNEDALVDVCATQ